jgi:GT2 family glycosyltransferase
MISAKMLAASIVTYKTNINDLKKVITCTKNSIVEVIYVIDNSPTDELKIISGFSNKIIYIFNNANLGYGKAHNIAIRKSIEEQTKYHIIINPDIFFKEGVIETLAKFMDDNEDIGHVMPKIIYPDGELQYLCKLIPRPVDLLSRRFIPSKSYKEKRMNKFQLKFTGYEQIMDIPYLSGCFMFLRIEALKKVGLFDERFFMYPEDIDLTRRIHKKYRTVMYPYVEVIHAHAAESYNNKKMLYIHISNMIKYFNKWGWFFDSERSKINQKILEELNYLEK